MKSKYSLVFKISLIILVLSAVAIAGICVFNKINPTDKKSAEKIVDRDAEHLSKIAEYFAGSGYEYIYIDKADCKKGVMFTGAQTREVKINDESVLDSVKILFYVRGYNAVGKNGNTVYFETWGLGGQHRGIAVTLNETSIPCVDFMIETEPLSKDGYHYYRTDYEESRNK